MYGPIGQEVSSDLPRNHWRLPARAPGAGVGVEGARCGARQKGHRGPSGACPAEPVQPARAL